MMRPSIPASRLSRRTGIPLIPPRPSLCSIQSLPLLFLCAVLSLFGGKGQAVELSQEIPQTQQKIEQLGKLEATPANQQLKEIYQQILSVQQEEQGYLDKAQSLKQQLKEHAARSSEMKQSVAELGAPQPEPAFEGKSLRELERLQETAAAEKIALQNQIDEIQNRLAQLQARLVPAQTELSEAKKNLGPDGLEAKISAAPLEGDLGNALLLKKRKIHDARAAQIQALGLELLAIPNQIELAGLQKELLGQKLKNLNWRQEKLQSQLRQLRQAESDSILDESLKLRKDTQEDPALAWLAEENVALGNQLALYAEKSQAVADRRSAIEQMAQLIDQRYTMMKQQLDLGGESADVGELMRQTLIQLKSLGAEDAPGTIGDIQKAQIQSLTYERQKSEALDKAGFVQAVVGRFPDSQLTISNPDMRERLATLLDLRANLIGKLLERNQQLLKHMSLLLNAQNQFNDQREQFGKLLMENLLWTATHRAMGFAWFADLAGGMDRAGLGEPWKSLPGQLGQYGGPLAGLSLAYAALLALLNFSARPRFQAWREAANGTVGNVRRDLFRNTLFMLAGEFLLSLPAPLFLLGLGKILLRSGADDAFALLLGESLKVAALAGLVLEFLRRLAKPGGFLEGQLRWPGVLAAALHGAMRFRWLLILLTAYIYVTETQTKNLFLYEFGRLPFLALCLALAAIARKPTRAWRSAVGGEAATAWNVNESPHLLGNLFVLCEIGLAGMEVFGFHLGALVLQVRLLKTLGWALAIVLAHQMLQRWLLLEQHRMAYARAQAMREERRQAGGGDDVDEADLLDKRRQFAEIQSISLQSKTLLNLLSGAAFLVAAGWIWQGLIPAFHLLDQVALWESAASGAGGASIETVTLKSLLLALVALGLMAAAARNLPGMLQLLVLQHLNLAPGSDFAVTSLLKYVIYVAGLVVACQLLGLQWNDLQWLVAALSVGLGFGLQEIFANFVSGLIILFEKPVRIGDTVTLGNGVTGTVDAINTRATTLTDWDNKEVIIPNKTLITAQLTNWSLSSRIIRVIIPVGIGYGADTELAQRLLLQAAEEHPLVLDKPEKAAFFRAFGASSLDFELRCFVANPGVRAGVVHDLNMRIDKLFREHGVEIAFPQMDVHIKGDAPAPPAARRGPDPSRPA